MSTTFDYHVWEDRGGAQVRWYGGLQVNLYINTGTIIGRDEYDRWVEVNVSSRGEWWADTPTLADVDEFARELLEEAHDEDSLFYG